MARAKLPEVETGGKDGMFQISWLRIRVCGSSDWLRGWNNAFVSQKKLTQNFANDRTTLFELKDHGFGRAIVLHLFSSPPKK